MAAFCSLALFSLFRDSSILFTESNSWRASSRYLRATLSTTVTNQPFDLLLEDTDRVTKLCFLFFFHNRQATSHCFPNDIVEIDERLTQAYFFTGFPASIESGISVSFSLGGKILEFSRKSFHFHGGNLEFPLSL